MAEPATLTITTHLEIPMSEIQWQAIRAQGPGGQNVNKVACAVHLSFDVRASSLPEVYKARLLRCRDHRMTRDGRVVIKAQRFRHQERNRQDALQRLAELIRKATLAPKKRRATRPSLAARRKRVDRKVKRGRLKALRGRVDAD